MYLKAVENVTTLGKFICLLFLFCLPILSILFLKTKRNDLARPVMGTIFLVVINQMRGLYESRDTRAKPRVARVYESRTNRALVHNYFIARKYCVLSRYVANNYINVFPANTFSMTHTRLY